MSVRLEERPIVRRRVLSIETLRTLVNRTIGARAQCRGILIRRIIVVEPDLSGCNWQAEWPIIRPANMEPCRTQLRGMIEELRARYNVEL
jgi:hypothetical protein